MTSKVLCKVMVSAGILKAIPLLECNIVVQKSRVLGNFAHWDILRIEGIRTFCLVGHISGLETLGNFGLKNQTRKRQNSQRFWTMSSFHVANCSSIFPKYILFTKRIETFWSRDIRIFELYKVLNCFKYFVIYILEQNVSKNQIRKTISSLHV